MSSTLYGFADGDAPLWDAYYADRARVSRSFAIPGHKGRSDIVGDLISADRPVALSHDMTVPSLGTVRRAEELAASAWGARHARFSVNGSSAANQAAMMAVAGPGDKVIVSRTLHKSLLFGLVHSGATPVWVRPDYDEATGLPVGVTVKTLEKALQENRDAVAVFVGEPSYIGSFGDVAGLADMAHQYGVPLVVDAAWAAHFGFHEGLPRNAIQLGADIMVTSAHKTLPAFTQGAIAFVSEDAVLSGRVDSARFDRVFDGTQTTSPSAAILASIDASRAVMVSAEGRRMLTDMLCAVRRARLRLASVPGLLVLAGDGFDPLKLVLVLPGTGVSGVGIASRLAVHGVEVEMAYRDMVIPQITIADTREDVETLVDLLLEDFERHQRGHSDKLVPGTGGNSWQVEPVMAMTPREAFYSPVEMVSATEAVGRVSAELVAPYPPGIPVLAPGELITDEVMGLLLEAREAGVHIAYATDPSLRSLAVVIEEKK